MKNKKNQLFKFPSELRGNTVSGDWVIIATGRAKRPETFKEKRKKVIPSPKNCPFCHLDEKEAIIGIKKGKVFEKGYIPKDWNVLVVKNKFPALVPYKDLNHQKVGVFEKMNGVGYCEVIVTKNHKKSLGELSKKFVFDVVEAYHQRYLDLMRKRFIKYVSIFHNHGREAGASVFHPHSQIIATPVIDPDLKKELIDTKKYYKKTKECLYCKIIEWERKEKERVVFENKNFLAICPFVSKTAFEVKILPKKHLPYFEKIKEVEKKDLAEALRVCLKKIYLALGDPSYNFYLHTSPCDGKDWSFYHWHFTILPKTSIWAGFELSTGIEISTIPPEQAAKYLKRH